jgi:hypothetical protein
VFNWNVHQVGFDLKRQQHRKLSWLDKDSNTDQSQFDELFNWTRVMLEIENLFLSLYYLGLLNNG